MSNIIDLELIIKIILIIHLKMCVCVSVGCFAVLGLNLRAIIRPEYFVYLVLCHRVLMARMDDYSQEYYTTL